MPRRSLFSRPVKGPAEEQYEKVRWGRRPRKRTIVDTPALRFKQDLVELGRLRKLFIETDEGPAIIVARRPYPYLAFGQKNNRLYICGHSTAAMARDREWGPPGASFTLLRVDYDAKKGDADAYWYHDHEPPYPRLVILESGFPAYYGGRYTVEVGGIVG